jgi:hypothetical protein
MIDEKRRTAILKAIADYTAEHTKTPQAARAALIREGIYTPAGELRPEYGGPGKQAKPKRKAARRA